MTGLKYATVLLALTVFSFWAVHGRSETTPEAQPTRSINRAITIRSVAFDNLYGNVKRVTVYVTVEDQAEQVATATCGPKTCTFEIPLTDARHELLMSVEHDGKRSEPARVTLDTRTP